MSEICIARQAIYGRELDIQAYELLHGSYDLTESADHENDDSISQDLTNAIIEIGLDELVGSQPALIHCSKEFLLQDLPSPEAGKQMVLEVLEETLSSESMVQLIVKLKNSGYAVALEEFIYEESKRPLVGLADIVKLNTVSMENNELERQVVMLKEFDVLLLADNLQSHDDFENCKALGFDLFQGSFITKPRIVTGKLTPSNKTAIMRLLAELQDPAIDFHKLEELITSDISLSHRILRYINSAMFSLRKSVDSIHKAITMIGLKPIKSWVSIIALSKIDDKPRELMTQALVRAKMCEQLAEEADLSAEVAFTIGLFSTLDALMDQQLRDVLAALPLSPETYAAILHYEGDLGELLALVLDYESGDWASLKCTAYAKSNLKQTYLEAVQWASEISSKLLSDID